MGDYWSVDIDIGLVIGDLELAVLKRRVGRKIEMRLTICTIMHTLWISEPATENGKIQTRYNAMPCRNRQDRYKRHLTKQPSSQRLQIRKSLRRSFLPATHIRPATLALEPLLLPFLWLLLVVLFVL